MGRVNREYQLAILDYLADNFVNPKILDEISEQLPQIPGEELRFEICYLMGHGLVEQRECVRQYGYKCKEYACTSAGVDFLEDDGGLRAILNTVTVKFDAENIKKLLENKVISSNLPQNEKSSIMATIKELPSSALQKIIDKLLEMGISNVKFDDLLNLFNG